MDYAPKDPAARCAAIGQPAWPASRRGRIDSRIEPVGTRRVLLEDPYARDVITMFDQITVARVGISAVEPSGLLAKSGNVTSPTNDRVIEIELDQLRWSDDL